MTTLTQAIAHQVGLARTAGIPQADIEEEATELLKRLEAALEGVVVTDELLLGVAAGAIAVLGALRSWDAAGELPEGGTATVAIADSCAGMVMCWVNELRVRHSLNSFDFDAPVRVAE